jgi:hypothetical protein
MHDIDRRTALRSMLGGVVAAGLGTSLLAESAKALPLALEKDLAAGADDAGPPVHRVATSRRPRPLAAALVLLVASRPSSLRVALVIPGATPCSARTARIAAPANPPRVFWPGIEEDNMATAPAYSAACSSGATRGRIIWMRVPLPGADSSESRPPSRVVTML